MVGVISGFLMFRCLDEMGIWVEVVDFADGAVAYERIGQIVTAILWRMLHDLSLLH